MNALGSIVGGAAALGIGFAVGSLSPQKANTGDESEPAREGPTTFSPSASIGTASDKTNGFENQTISYSTFAEAQPELNELCEQFRRYGNYGRHSAPLRYEKVLEKIEQILNLADPGELEEFLTKNEVVGDTFDLFEIGLAILVRTDAERAVEIARERWEETPGNYRGMLAIIREWEKQDPSAVDRWIGTLEDEEMAIQARHNLLSLRAASDPAGVLRQLDEIDAAKGSGISQVLAQTLDLSEMPETADQILGKREDGTNAATMLPNFLVEWGSRDSEAMMAWLFVQDLDAIGPDLLRQALGRQIIDDPGEFLAKIDPVFPKQPALRKAAGQAWWAWLTSEDDPVGAMHWLERNQELATGFASWEIADWATRDENWTAERTAEVLEAFVQIPDSDSKTVFAQDFFERLSRYHGETVLPYAIDYLPLGSRSRSTIARVVSNWARSGDAETAVNWSLENLDDQNTRHDAVRFAVGSWSEDDPQSAASFAMSLTGKDRDSALDGLAYNWARKDPDSIVSFLNQADDPEVVSELTKDAFRVFGEDKSGSAYLETALNMQPGKMRHDAVRGLFSGWALSSSERGVEALEKVPEGSLRNVAIMGFNSFTSRRDPALAFELVGKISVEKMRNQQLINQGRYWMREQPDKAEASIRANPSVPQSVKEKIFSNKN